MDDIQTVIDQLGPYLSAAIAIGVAILLFTLGRAIVEKVVLEREMAEEQYEDYLDYMEDMEKHRDASDDCMDMYDDIGEAYAAGEIDEDEAQAIADEYYS